MTEPDDSEEYATVVTEGPLFERVAAALEALRPTLQADGGDLQVLEMKGNILTVRYEGACGSCPSSQAGTLEAIEGILRTEFREDIRVEAV